MKGWRNPNEYFDLFRNSLSERKDSHVWFRNKVVTLFDDHDQVRKGENKARFCADPEGPITGGRGPRSQCHDARNTVHLLRQ